MKINGTNDSGGSNSSTIVIENVVVNEKNLEGTTYTNEDAKYMFQLKGDNLTSVDLPNVEVIAPLCFKDNLNLEEVSLPLVTEIPESTFNGCTSLTTVDLPNVEIVETYAFAFCENLSVVQLPSVQEVKEDAFNNCSNLETIVVPDTATVEDNAIPSGVTQMTPEEYEESLNNPSEPGTDPDPEPGTDPEPGDDNPSTEKLTMDSWSEDWSEVDGVAPTYIFAVQENNWTYTIVCPPVPGSELEGYYGTYEYEDEEYSYGFWNDTELLLAGIETLEYPSGASILYYTTYSYTDGMEDALTEDDWTILVEGTGGGGTDPDPEPDPEPGDDDDSDHVTYSDFSEDWTTRFTYVFVIGSYDENDDLTVYDYISCPPVSPDELEMYTGEITINGVGYSYEIWNDTDFMQVGISTLTIPSEYSLYYFKADEFDAENPELPTETLALINTDGSVTGDAPILTTELRNTAETIGNNRFAGRTDFIDVENPVCTSVGNSAFANCTSLQVVILENCTSIGNNAFYGCSDLSEVYLPNVQTIGEHAFDGTSLTRLELPSVESITCALVNYPSSITEVYLAYDGVVSCSIRPYLCFLTTTNIYVPADRVDEYKADSNWSELADRIFAIEE